MKMRWNREFIPWAMAAGRAGLGPVMLLGAACGWNGLTLGGLVVTALLSDIFDGVLARRWECDTAAVRLFDSMADTFFYLCVWWALWVARPGMWRADAGLLAAVVALEVFRFGLDFAKFGKPASYHSYLAKLWGLTLAVAVVAAFAAPSATHAEMMMRVSLWVGVVNLCEGIVMSLVLPVWVRDVKTLGAAWKLRVPTRGVGVKAVAAGVVLVVACAFAASAGAQAPVEYRGGTLPNLRVGEAGEMEHTAADVLTVRFAASGPASQVSLAVPYEDIRSVRRSAEPRHRLGLLAIIAADLVAGRQREYLVSITYKDKAGVLQVMRLEMAKSEQASLLEVLKTRAPQACVGDASCSEVRRFGLNQ